MVKGKTHTLVLVDDEKAVIKAIKRLFRNEEYNVISAPGGIEALELLSEYGEDVSLIISDQQMPKMTGLQFLEKAKEICPHSIRYLLTGYTEESLVKEGLRKGIIHKYLLKPWNDEELLLLVHRGIERLESGENQKGRDEIMTGRS
jgi:YesN/AraC family two-component response regulator